MNPESPAVLAHLNLVQAVINRLASNSASCKTWCVTLVAAVVVFVAQQGSQRVLAVCLIPIGIFCFLDAYYLSLERNFRRSYQEFVKKLHNGEASTDDLFQLVPSHSPPGVWGELPSSLLSPSVWIVYAGIAVLLWLVAGVVTGSSAVPTR